MGIRMATIRASLLAFAAFQASAAFAGTAATFTASGGNWNVGANWSTNPVVPLNAGATTYDVTISGTLVDYNVAGSNAIDSLALSGGLDLGTGDNLTVVNGLTVPGGTLYAQSAIFSAQGSVSMDSSSLYADAGGSISLPGLVSYSTTTDEGFFQADGVGSQLLLANLSSVALTRNLNVGAQNGAELDLNALTSLTGTGTILFQAAESGSILRLNALESLATNGTVTADANGANATVSLPALTTIALQGTTDTLSAMAGGDVEAPLLATVTYTGVGFEQLKLQATGAGSVVNAPLLGASPMVRVYVEVQTGGTVLWGQPTSVTGSTILVDTGGTLDTSHLTTIDSTSLTATNGATLSIPVALFSTTSLGPATWQASNAGSLLILPNLTAITLAGNNLTLSAVNGGEVELPALTALIPGTSTLHLTTSGAASVISLPASPAWNRLSISMTDGTILWGAPTTLQNSSVTINSGGTINLAALTNIASTSFTASGGAAINIPTVTTYATAGTLSATITANAGSSVTFPLLASVSNPSRSGAGIFNVTATGAGALVSLPALATVSINGQSDTFSAASGGDVELPALAGVTNAGSSLRPLNLDVTGTGSLINVPLLGPATVSNVAVSLQGGTITWGNPTVLQASSVTVTTSGSIALAQLTNIDSTSLNAAGGATITLPNVTAYGTVPGAGATLQASGTNSTLSLPALVSVTNPGTGFTSTVTFLASGSGSQTLLNALQTVVVDSAPITFQASYGGTVQAGALTTVSTTGSIFGGFNAYADGAGAKVLLTGLTDLQLNTGANNLRASAGGDLEMPALVSITGLHNLAQISVQSTGAGSLVDLAALHPTSSAPVGIYLSKNGEIDLGGVAAPCLISFSADFIAGSSGTLDVYSNQLLLTSINPGNFGVYGPFQLISGTTQPGTPTVRLVANGASASVDVMNYSAAPLLTWSGAAGESWDASAANLNWNGSAAWVNNATRSNPNAAMFNLGTPVAITVNDNIDVGTIIFSTGGWTLDPGNGVLAYGGTGAINVTAADGTDTVNAIIADGSTFGTGGGATSLLKSGPGALILGGANSYTGGTTISAGTLIIATAGALPNSPGVFNSGSLLINANSAAYAIMGSGGTTVEANASFIASLIEQGSLTVNGVAVIAPDAANPVNRAASMVAALTIAGSATPTGVLNINNNQLIISNGGAEARDAASADIAYARNGGLWNQPGITSTTAQAAFAATHFDSQTLGVVLNSDLPTPYTVFASQSVNPNDVLIAFTYGGDANLDGTINGNDYFQIDRGFLDRYNGWVNGDFNYDGTVNGNDYFIIDSNFIDQSGKLAASEVLAHAAEFGPSYLSEFTSAQLAEIGVPEPASVALLGLGFVGLVVRRRRGATRRR